MRVQDGGRRVISIRGQVMECMYIPTGIKRELMSTFKYHVFAPMMRFGIDCDRKG